MRAIFAFTALAAVTGPAFEALAAGLAGAEFSQISIGINNTCNEKIFKGTERFKGQAYLLPKATLVDSASRYPIVELKQTANGGSVLRFGLRFFGKPGGHRMRIAQNRLASRACDLVRLEQALNKQEKEREKGSAVTYHLVPMTLSNVLVTIDGFDKDKQQVRIGHENTGVLMDDDHFIEFTLNAQEAEQVMARLRSTIGLVLKLDYAYWAQTVDSYVTLTTQGKAIAEQLEAKLTLSGILPNAMVGKGTIETELSNVLTERRMDFYAEGKPVDDQIFKEMTSSLINAVNAAATPPANSGERKQGEAKEDGAPGAAPRISVRAAIEAVRRVEKGGLRYQRLGEAEIRTAHSTMAFAGDFHTSNEMDFRELRSDDSYPVAVIPYVRKGETYGLAPMKSIRQRINDLKVTHYLSPEEIEAMGAKFAMHFPDIMEWFSSTLLRTQNFPGGSRAYMSYDTLSWWLNGKWKYLVWGYHQWVTSEEADSGLFDQLTWYYDQKTPGAAFDESKAPIRAFFGNEGDGYTLKQLATETNDWSGAMGENGVLRFTAKRDLGPMYLNNVAGDLNLIPTRSDYPKQYFQQVWQVYGKKPFEVTPSRIDQLAVIPTERLTVFVKVLTFTAQGESSQVRSIPVSVSP